MEIEENIKQRLRLENLKQPHAKNEMRSFLTLNGKDWSKRDTAFVLANKVFEVVENHTKKVIQSTNFGNDARTNERVLEEEVINFIKKDFNTFDPEEQHFLGAVIGGAISLIGGAKKKAQQTKYDNIKSGEWSAKGKDRKTGFGKLLQKIGNKIGGNKIADLAINDRKVEQAVRQDEQSQTDTREITNLAERGGLALQNGDNATAMIIFDQLNAITNGTKDPNIKGLGERLKNALGGAINMYKEQEKSKEINKMLPIIIGGVVILLIVGLIVGKKI